MENSGTNAAATGRCPRCGKSWPSTMSTCPEDGGDLKPTSPHDLHGMETFRLANGRRWDESPTVALVDNTETDKSESETALHIRESSGPTAPTSLTTVGAVANQGESTEITAETGRAIESFPPPAPERGSNPDPTTRTRLDPGFVHLVAGTLVDAYEIEKLLGSGGMGAVYGAHHERIGRRVAIKVIAPAMSRDRDATERFEQEAVALARLSHPNIVSVLSVGTLPGDGRSYYIMEWLDGQSLQARVELGRLPTADALDILDQIARGLEAAHGAGIVHRDLKPGNVWLQRVGDEARSIVKILDLGLAKLAEHRRTEETAVGVMFGTPQYMSPEQCQSARDVGPATDVYALGAIAYELLCGRLPFLYDNIAELIVAHQTEEPPRPRELASMIDPPLDELLFAMLAKDSAQRPTVAIVRSIIGTVRKRLAADAVDAQAPHTSSSTITAPRAATTPTAQPLRTRRGIVAASAAALLVLSFMLVRSATRSDDTHSAEPRAVPRVDGSVRNESRPAATVSPPAIAVEAPVDARIATPKPPARPLNAARTLIPIVPNIENEQVDAGSEVSTDADAGSSIAVEVDAGRTADESQAQPTQAPSEVKPPVTDRNPGGHTVDRKSQRLDKKPTQAPDRKPVQTPDRNPTRDRTFNPFTKKPPR